MKKAPLTAEEVESINAFQKAGVVHPFTCGVDGTWRGMVPSW